MKLHKSPVSALLLLLLLMGCLITQQAKTGDMLFQEKKYAEAISLLKNELNREQDPDIKSQKAYMIAESYRLSGQTIPAEEWYLKANEYNEDQKARFMYATMQKSNEKYEAAIKTFTEYLKENPFDEVAKDELEACAQAADWKKAASNFTVENMTAINSNAFDYSPAFYDKNSLVFTSDRSEAAGENIYGWTGEKFSDLYQATRDNKGKFSAPITFNDKFNTEFNEGAAQFNKDFTECFFTRCGSNITRNDYCQIYFSVKNNFEWSDPIALSIFHDSCNVVHPFLSADEKELYISSDADGGYGGKDLYVLTKNADGEFSNPQNLGPTVNTTGDEVFPYLSADGKLYFSSTGHAGMGGLDIFVATKLKNQWANVQNLRSPLNSGADDCCYLPEKISAADQYKIKSQGYFVSNRPGGKGKDDIYHFVEEKTKVYLVQGDLVEKEFERADDPNSRITRYKPIPQNEISMVLTEADGNVIANSQKKIKSDNKGNFKFSAETDKYYKLSASRMDYFSKSEQFNTIGFSKQEKDTIVVNVRIVLDKIFKNVQVNLSNIYYDYNKANIRNDAAVVLDTLVTLLKENTGVKVEFGSHTDSRGQDAYNLRLSQARAQSVVDYLVSRGIDASRLSAKGYGETQPVNKCTNGVKCSEEEFQLNRRTTFKVTSAEFTIESVAPEIIVQDSTMQKK